jgi:hypothetical protein
VLTSKTPKLRGLAVLLEVLREIMNGRRNGLENYLLPDHAVTVQVVHPTAATVVVVFAVVVVVFWTNFASAGV